MEEKIIVGRYVYNKVGNISNEWIKCGHIEYNFEGVPYIVWYA